MVRKPAPFSLFTVIVMAAPALVGFSSPANGLVATRAAVRTVASATTTSSIVGSRLPVGANVEANGLGVADLTSVSCPTSGFCTAVDAAGFAYIYERGAWSSGRRIASRTSILNSVSMSYSLVLHGSCGQHERSRGIHVPVFARQVVERPTLHEGRIWRVVGLLSLRIRLRRGRLGRRPSLLERSVVKSGLLCRPGDVLVLYVDCLLRRSTAGSR